MQHILVCREGEIAEDGVRILEVGKTEIAIIRYGGKYYAYNNLCPHQGGPVCEGIRMPAILDVIAPDQSYLHQTYDLNDIHIVCPWHAYEFHLDSGVNVCNPDLRLKKFNVWEKDGAVYIDV